MQRIENGHALLAADEGELIEVAGNRIRIKVASASQLVCDYDAAPHFPGPPMHIHPGFDESYLVLEGRLAVIIEEQHTVLEPGAIAYVSGSVPHTFSNPDGQRARFLSVCSPGGFEQFFRAVATGDHEAIAAIAARVGYTTVERG
jgi:mannose-6-phosphate isomerase-like protein (cupin superfamily)